MHEALCYNKCMITLILSTAAIVLFFMTFVFFIAQILKDNSIVDIAWGLGFVIIALYTLGVSHVLFPRQILVTLLVLIWGVRLSTHIFVRKKGRGEDFRYRDLRMKWKKNAALKAYISVFLLQSVLMLIIALPIIFVNHFNGLLGNDLTSLDNIGLVIWSFGFVFEVLADFQLGRFRKDARNKGKIMTGGLWKYSRHPNYFGEVLMWWGIFVIAVASPQGFYTLVSPLVITNLILFFSGIPLLEKKYKNNPDFQKYAKKTPVFVPNFFKK